MTLDPESKKVTRIAVTAANLPRGTIKEIDLKKKTMDIAPVRGESFSVLLGDKVTVEKYFRTIPISDVKPGMVVSVGLGDDRKTVNRMTISDRNGVQLTLGRIKSLDAAKRTITIDRPTFGTLKPMEPITYKVAEEAAIMLSGENAKFADLETGTNVNFYVDMDTIVGLSNLFTAGRFGTISKVDVKTSTVTIKVYDENVTCVVDLNTKIRQVRKTSRSRI